MDKTYDLAIVGSGPGGYAASLRAAELGLKVCIIEKDLVGGTCLNWGCIPTKALVRSADLFADIKQAHALGIDIDSYRYDMSRIIERKQTIVDRLRNGAEGLLQSKGIDIYRSKARIISPSKIQAAEKQIETKHILIATGSRPSETDSLRIDHNFVLSSRDMLELKDIPKKIVVIGGGFIGCEFASIYSRLGVEVTIIELMDQLLPGFDREIARRLESIFKKDNIKVLKNTKVLSARQDPKGVVMLSDKSTIETDKVFLCIGRKPYIDDLNLEKVGVATEKGAVVVDENLKTNIPTIYSVGDANGTFFLAHTASYEGAFIADNIAGVQRKLNYSAVPKAIFTKPEIATVGLDSSQAKAANIDTESLKIPFAAVSKAHILGETEGFVKLEIEVKTKKILGACLFGPLASELISGFTIAIRHGLTTRDISDTIFAHPTLSESFLQVSEKGV
jgi:dihydrolipoamide dehydrogenase